MIREIGCVVAPEDDGRLVKRVVRSRLGVSHRQFTSLKRKNAVLLDGAPAAALSSAAPTTFLSSGVIPACFKRSSCLKSSALGASPFLTATADA